MTQTIYKSHFSSSIEAAERGDEDDDMRHIRLQLKTNLLSE